jgi:hypothetical protein
LPPISTIAVRSEPTIALRLSPSWANSSLPPIDASTVRSYSEMERATARQRSTRREMRRPNHSAAPPSTNAASRPATSTSRSTLAASDAALSYVCRTWAVIAPRSASIASPALTSTWS